MPRKGWTQIEVPHGWTQLIRGVRPKIRVATSRVTESGPAWSVASTNSEGKSRGVPTCSKTTRTTTRSRSRGFRRFERRGGHHVGRIIEVRTSCNSGSAVGCASCTVRAVRESLRSGWLHQTRNESVSELEECQARVMWLRVEIAQRHQDANPAAPVPPPD